MSWFDLARGYCRYQVGGHQGEMGLRLCNYVEQGFTYFGAAPQPTTAALPSIESNDPNITTKGQYFMREASLTESGIISNTEPHSTVTGSCSQSLTKIPVPYSEYTKTLLEKLDDNKNIQLSEEEKADADLEALASSYKNNIQYEKEMLATKLEFCTSNLDVLNGIVTRQSHNDSQPEVTSGEDITLDKITRHINVLKPKRNTQSNQTVEELTFADELTVDLDKFKRLIATLSKAERAEFTTLIASVGKIIRKMEIVTPLLDAYIFIFLIRNSTVSEKVLLHINGLLGFLSEHSTQLRLEPELTHLVEVTVQTKLISELTYTTSAVTNGHSLLHWRAVVDPVSQKLATQIHHQAVCIRNKIADTHRSMSAADLVWVEEVKKDYDDALRNLNESLSIFGRKIQNTVEVHTRIKNSLFVPVLVGASYFVAGFMQGR